MAILMPETTASADGEAMPLVERASFIDSGPQWKAAVTAYRDEIRRLQTA